MDGQGVTQDPVTVRYRLPGMDCPSCARGIHDRLMRIGGVLSVESTPLNRNLTVTLDPGSVDDKRIQQELERMGYPPQRGRDVDPPRGTSGYWRKPAARIAYASIALFGLAMVLRGSAAASWTVPLLLSERALPDVLLLASALVGGWNFFPKGLRAARALALDMNFLMTAAIIGAVAIGEYTEASVIAFLFALAELLEGYAVERARASVAGLMEVAPEQASIVRGGAEVSVPTREIVAGDLVLVRPGDRVPADGRVEEGASAIDQSLITGESVPVDKGPGDEVFSGTINRSGFLKVRVTHPAKESALARIVSLVEAAQAERSPTERVVERFARYYTPAVTAAALVTMSVPPLLLGGDFQVWFVRSLTLLVIACPCALVISTPVAVVSGIAAAARSGILIKGGRYLEALGDVKVVALDKTGTLTEGRPRLVKIQAVSGMSETEALSRAAALEVRSEHPIARAIVQTARDRGISPDHDDITDFIAEAGSGTRARLAGVEHRLGKPSWLGGDPAAQEAAVALAREGRTVVGLAAEGDIVAWFALADEPRTDATAAVSGLYRAGVRHVAMLTGDSATTASAIARRVGIDDVRAALMPEHKVGAVRTLEAEFGPVAMVGDGVNDAPAMATATVGIAMGAAGSDTAMETADVALMGDDLTRLPQVLLFSRRVRSVIRQNIAASVVVKAVLAFGVPYGMVSLVTAVLLGDLGVSLAVILNALRLGRVLRARPADGGP